MPIILCYCNNRLLFALKTPCFAQRVAKGNISTFVLPLFDGLWPLSKATRFTVGSLLLKNEN